MADHYPLWRQIQDYLRQNTPVALLLVVESTGSSPGKIGAKMALAANGEPVGTIGGGLMEYHLVKQARRLLQIAKPCCVLHHQVHDETATARRSGIVCGGAQTVATCLCTRADLSAIHSLMQTAGKREKGLLRLAPEGISFIPDQVGAQKYHFNYESQGKWSYEEQVGTYNTVYLIGGGHISLALSRILATLDFRIVVFDERPNVTSLRDNAFAHEKVITPYKQIHAQIPAGDQSYVVIMTPLHKTDELVLRQLIDKRLRYLAMLGSQMKVTKIFEHLGKSVSAAVLQRVRAPAGLPIHSHSPEEIAVSIAAEMIKVKNSGAQG